MGIQTPVFGSQLPPNFGWGGMYGVTGNIGVGNQGKGVGLGLAIGVGCGWKQGPLCQMGTGEARQELS